MNKLLVLSNANGYGGAEKSLESIVKELVKKYDVYIIVENDEHKKNLSSKAKIIQLPKGKGIFSILISLFILIKVLVKNNYKNILVNTNKGAFFIAIVSYLGILKKSKLLIYIRDFQWKYQKFIFRSLNSTNHTYLLTTQAFFDYESFFSKNIKKYKIIPNFVNEPNIIKKTILDKKVILLPAMINRWKGIEYLIEAVNLLKDKIELEVWILGQVIDTTYYNELNKRVEIYELQNIIKFLSYTNDLSYYYSNADVIVNTSVSEYGGPETFGRTIIEAWSYGKPVIAFNCGGPKYLVKNGINGFLVKEKDFRELESKLILLLNDSNLIRKNCYLTFQQEYLSFIIMGKLYALFI